MKPCASDDHHEQASLPPLPPTPARSLGEPPAHRSGSLPPRLPPDFIDRPSARPVHTPSLAIGARANQTDSFNLASPRLAPPRPRLLPTAQFRSPYSDTPLKRRLHYKEYHPNQPQLQEKQHTPFTLVFSKSLWFWLIDATAIYLSIVGGLGLGLERRLKVLIILIGFGL